MQKCGKVLIPHKAKPETVSSNTLRKLLHIIILLTFIKTAYSQTDSLKISPYPFDSTATFIIDLVSADSVSAFAFNRWGQVLDTAIADTVLQAGHYEFGINTTSWQDDNYYFIVYLSGGRHLSRVAPKISSQTGIASGLKATTVLSVYPNPTNDLIILTKEFSGVATFINSIGIIAKTVTLHGDFISIKDLPCGQYTLRLTTKDGKAVESVNVLRN